MHSMSIGTGEGSEGAKGPEGMVTTTNDFGSWTVIQRGCRRPAETSSDKNINVPSLATNLA